MRVDVICGFFALACAAGALVWYMPAFMSAMNGRQESSSRDGDVNGD